MDNNLKLRKAIIIAIALMGTGYSMHSKAIGLGDILVKSYLGQPLLASVKVNGVNEKTDSSCFSVSSNAANAISDVKFSLNKLANNEGVLTISSKSAVLEPIASLTIVSNCETTFSRQYDLLIDPENLSNNTTSSVDFSNSYAATSIAKPLNLLENTTSIEKEVNSNIKRSTKAKLSTKSSNTVKAKASTDASTDNNIRDTSKAKSASVSQPKLTISGGGFFNNAFEPITMKLNFDKNINTSRASNPNAYAEEAAFSDEITVMNNRLAHLDKQLNSLRVQNRFLKNANLASNTQIEEIKRENDFLRMLSFFFGGGLLASSYFFIDWYRRRNINAKAEKEQAIWQALEEDFKENDPIEVPKFTKDEHQIAESSNQGHFEVKTVNEFSDDDHSHIFNSVYPNQESDFVEEVTSVTDDAKLFLSHGRTGLAIQLLQNHLIDFPRESAETWLLLLEILAKEGKEEEFETAANECKKYFNVDIPKFAENSENTGGIESHERICSDLQKVWGTPEAASFLDDLIHNMRNQPRAGLNKALFEELVLLREVVQEEVKLAEVIPLKNQKSSAITKKEPAVSHHFPEIEISSEFKELGKQLELENTTKPTAEPEVDHFEFELLDLAHR